MQRLSDKPFSDEWLTAHTRPITLVLDAVSALLIISHPGEAREPAGRRQAQATTAG